MSARSKFMIVLFILLITLSFTAFYLQQPKGICDTAQCVSVSDIKKSLNNAPPMAVGFDIDETVLFASPVFYHVASEQCDGAVVACMQTLAFWEATNQLDSFSLPKSKGVALVNMHLERGDTVYFITARRGTESETVTNTLRKLFKSPDLAEVIFTGYSTTENLKIAPIKERNIQIFYGDSDTDITAAIAANARAIRILRAPNTLENHNAPKVGAYDEEVVEGSAV